MGLICESDISAITALYDAFGLSAKEALVVILLARGGVIYSYRVRDVYCDQPERTSPIEARSAIKRIRKKTRHAFKIRSIYGIGYELTPQSLKTVRQIVKGNRHGNDIGTEGSRGSIAQGRLRYPSPADAGHSQGR